MLIAARRTPVGASSAMIWADGVTGMAGDPELVNSTGAVWMIAALQARDK
jgi:hypothetical protein